MSEVPVSAGGRKPPALMRSCSQASDGSQIDSLQPEYDAAALMGDEPPHRHRPSVVAEIQAGAGPRRDPLSSRQPQTGTIPTPKRRSMEARSVPHPLTLDLLPVSNTIQHKSPSAASPSVQSSPGGRMVKMVGRTTARNDSVDVVAVPGRIKMKNAAPGTQARTAAYDGGTAASGGTRMVRGGNSAHQTLDSVAYEKPTAVMRRLQPTTK
mmetsp:Transcript_38398/g.68855  ORF Transcript_38398/g.68855 Transcript_38398/m.68855 type:complete len:210 (-) Transcript_38398:429-1058(-)